MCVFVAISAQPSPAQAASPLASSHAGSCKASRRGYPVSSYADFRTSQDDIKKQSVPLPLIAYKFNFILLKYLIWGSGWIDTSSAISLSLICFGKDILCFAVCPCILFLGDLLFLSMILPCTFHVQRTSGTNAPTPQMVQFKGANAYPCSSIQELLLPKPEELLLPNIQTYQSKFIYHTNQTKIRC